MTEPHNPTDHVRRRLLALVLEHRTNLATVSRDIGRNHAYLHQFVYRGSPKRLPELARQALASYFAVPDDELLAPEERVQRKALLALTPGIPRSGPSAADIARSEVLNSFAARLAVARAESPYGVPSAFAETTGIDPMRYAELEDGEDDPTLDELDRIARASGKSLDWLIRGEDRMAMTQPPDTTVGRAASGGAKRSR